MQLLNLEARGGRKLRNGAVAFHSVSRNDRGKVMADAWDGMGSDETRDQGHLGVQRVFSETSHKHELAADPKVPKDCAESKATPASYPHPM